MAQHHALLYACIRIHFRQESAEFYYLSQLNGGGVPPDSSNGGLPTPTVESSAAPSAGTGGEMEGEAVAGAELEGGVPSPPRSGFEALNNAGRRQSQSDSGEPQSGPSTALGRICLSTAQHR